MNEQLFVQLWEMGLIALTAAGIAGVVGGAWYDLGAIRRRKHLATVSQALTPATEPAVAVLIYASNHQSTIESCLDSVTASDYTNYTITVVDNHSSDATRRIAQRYQQANPHQAINTRFKRQTTQPITALQSCYSRGTKADLVVCIDGNTNIANNLLSSLATQFVADTSLVAASLMQRPLYNQSLETLPHQYASTSYQLGLKCLSILAWVRMPANGRCAAYTDSVFRQLSAADRIHYRHISTLPPLARNPRSTSALLFLTRRPPASYFSSAAVFVLLLLVIASVTYFFYTAATLQSSSLLTLSWILLTVWLLTTVWSDEQIDNRDKLALAAATPVAYFLFYALSILSVAKRITAYMTVNARPRAYFDKLASAVKVELYSVRY